MKYKELNIGDWFIHNERKFIKTISYSGDTIDVSLEENNFGTPMLLSTIDDDEEVKFLTEFTYTKPRDIDDDAIRELRDVPNGALCSFNNAPNDYFVLFSGWAIDITSPSRVCGAWRSIDYAGETPFNLMMAGVFKYEEKA